MIIQYINHILNIFFLNIRKIDINESEEHSKNIVYDLLKDTYYKDSYEINTYRRKYLVLLKEQ